jgi:hypothetical protein
MPVIHDPRTPEALCEKGRHDLPFAGDYAFGTIYECDRPLCKVQYYRDENQRDGAFWRRHTPKPSFTRGS